MRPVVPSPGARDRCCSRGMNRTIIRRERKTEMESKILSLINRCLSLIKNDLIPLMEKREMRREKRERQRERERERERERVFFVFALASRTISPLFKPAL